MHPSAVVALALVAAAGPALGAPSRRLWSKRQAVTDQSGAISVSDVGAIVDIGNDVLNGAETLKTIFTGQSKREEVPLVARQAQPITSVSATSVSVSASASATPSSYVPSAVLTVDPVSGAISISEVGDIVTIGNDVLNGADTLKNIITDHSKRDVAATLLQRQASTTSTSSTSTAPSVTPSMVAMSPQALSAAISLGTIAKIGSGIDQALDGLQSFFGSQDSGSNNQRRQVTVDSASGAISFGDIGDIASLVGDGVQSLESLFGRDIGSQNSKRHGAISFGPLGNTAKIIGDGVIGSETLFGGDNSQNSKREVTVDPASGAISFGAIGDIASLIGDGVQGLESLFGGSSQNQRRAPFTVVPGQTPPTLPTVSGLNGGHPLFLFENDARSIADLD